MGIRLGVALVWVPARWLGAAARELGRLVGQRRIPQGVAQAG